jgi:hypothetical protein
MDLTEIGEIGISMIVGNGHNISLWKDRWQGDSSLSSSYHHLFQLCSTSDLFYCGGVWWSGFTF